MRKSIILFVFTFLIHGIVHAQYETFFSTKKPFKTTLIKDTTYSEFIYEIKSFPKWAEELCNKEQRQYLDSLFNFCSYVNCLDLVMCKTHPSMIENVVQTTRRFFPLSHYTGKSVQLMSLNHKIYPVKNKQCNYKQYVIYKGFSDSEVKVLLNIYYTIDDNKSVEISHYDVVAEGPEGTYPKLKKGKWPLESKNILKLYSDGSFGGTIFQTLIYTSKSGRGIKENVNLNFITNLLE